MNGNEAAGGRREEGRMARMSVMGRSGHEVVEWTLDEPETVEAARAKFDEIVQAYYSPSHSKTPVKAAVIDPRTRRGERIISEFDPMAEEIMILVPMAGG